ncbi:MAG: glycosyltransferase family 39 protein [Thermoleophilia bacterium]|jgi:hypothetical protein|nr:glycosyltransferase family 39 protein [Thermoleophilia bacterium]
MTVAGRMPARVAGLSRPVAVAVTLAGVLAGGLALRLWAFGGVTFAHGGDDGRYVQVAQNLALGHLPDGPTEWFGARAAFLWPVAVLFRTFGADDVTAVLWPLACSLLAVLAAFLIGRELASARVGLIAAALVAVAPLEVLLATRLRPDAVMPAFVALAMWCALRARRGGRPAWWIAAAGVLLGAGWSARESAIVMLPVLVLAAWPALRERPRSALAGLAGIAVVPALTVAAFGVLAGRPLWPLTATQGAGDLRGPLEGWRATTSYAEQLARAALDPRAVLALALPAVVLAAGALVWRRDRRALLPGAWLAWGALYLEVGTLVNLDKPQRFLTLLTVPAALLVALAVDGWPALVAVPALVALCLVVLAPWPGRERRADDVVLLTQVVRAMRDLPRAPVLAESHTWWAKLNAYLPVRRQRVRAATDPQFLTGVDRVLARRLRPLPPVGRSRGGYVVVGPAGERAAWPRNWSRFRRAMRAEVPWSRLVPVLRVGDVRVYSWPAAVPPVPAPGPGAGR